jgi:hypothetical protein
MPYKNKADQSGCAKRHYQRNRESMILRAKKFKPQARNRNRIFVDNYLSTHSCVDCGEEDPVVLEFDHVFGKKKDNIADAIQKAWSLKKIQEEIIKCEVRCANCHRRKTHERRLPKVT